MWSRENTRLSHAWGFQNWNRYASFQRVFHIIANFACSLGGGALQAEPAKFSSPAAQSGKSNLWPFAAPSLRVLQQRRHSASPHSTHAPLCRAPGMTLAEGDMLSYPQSLNVFIVASGVDHESWLLQMAHLVSVKSHGSSMTGSQSLHDQSSQGVSAFQESLSPHRPPMPRQNSDPTSETPLPPPRVSSREEKFDRSSWLRQEEEVPPKVRQIFISQYGNNMSVLTWSHVESSKNNFSNSTSSYSASFK